MKGFVCWFLYFALQVQLNAANPPGLCENLTTCRDCVVIGQGINRCLWIKVADNNEYCIPAEKIKEYKIALSFRNLAGCNRFFKLKARVSSTTLLKTIQAAEPISVQGTLITSTSPKPTLIIKSDKMDIKELPQRNKSTVHLRSDVKMATTYTSATTRAEETTTITPSTTHSFISTPDNINAIKNYGHSSSYVFVTHPSEPSAEKSEFMHEAITSSSVSKDERTYSMLPPSTTTESDVLTMSNYYKIQRLPFKPSTPPTVSMDIFRYRQTTSESTTQFSVLMDPYDKNITTADNWKETGTTLNGTIACNCSTDIILNGVTMTPIVVPDCPIHTCPIAEDCPTFAYPISKPCVHTVCPPNIIQACPEPLLPSTVEDKNEATTPVYHIIEISTTPSVSQIFMLRRPKETTLDKLSRSMCRSVELAYRFIRENPYKNHKALIKWIKISPAYKNDACPIIKSIRRGYHC